jgi:hypothetical protein
VRIEGGSTAVKSKVKSQKSKRIQRKFFRDLEWLVYLRRSVLGVMIQSSVLAKPNPTDGFQ